MALYYDYSLTVNHEKVTKGRQRSHHCHDHCHGVLPLCVRVVATSDLFYLR
ncbi:hypothetical protein BGW80DRAFT_1317305 [Lactifluus volemus]|nr:hypothetical protein BGW80DRAFT_1317305 [Lactifluus volemus]